MYFKCILGNTVETTLQERQSLMLSFVAASVAIVKSRDLHWGLLATKDHKDINLASVRMLLVADGANPCKSLPSPKSVHSLPTPSIVKFLFSASRVHVYRMRSGLCFPGILNYLLIFN